MEKRKHESGIVVLSYDWKNTIATADGVMNMPF
jgi:hypothetical protein